MSSSISRVQAANVDGRARSPRFVQEQLGKLHATLVENLQDIHQAICNDSRNSSAEAGIEYYLSLSFLKAQYGSIDLKSVLDDEYRVANGKDAPQRRIAAGIVYIVPSPYALFYSVITPLSAAIAAGNCVILELETTLSEVVGLLRKLLPEALDDDTFAIVESRPENAVLSSCLQVFGEQADEAVPTANQLISPSTARVVALVDRTADIENAASALVNARFSFRGRSPYAPNVVLVNEFVMNDFSNAVAEKAARFFAKRVTANNSTRAGAKQQGLPQSFVDEKFRDEEAVVLLSGAHGSIIHVKKRASRLLQRKVTEPVLLIHPITSLDDGIDFANQGDKPLLASFIFATPPTAKYLGQFIDAYISCVDQVPIELLVGPASPLNHTPSIQNRYSKAMFEVPRPQFIEPVEAQSQSLRNALVADESDVELRTLAVAPLSSLNRRPGKAVGFFEQGLFTGAIGLMVPALTGAAVLGYYGIRILQRRIKG